MTHPHLEGLIRKWREDASDYRYVAEPSAPDRAEELEAAADELEAALAALPGGGVDATAADLAELAYWRQSEAKFMDHLSQNDGLNHRQRIAEIRRALSPTPNPHEADRNG